MIVSTEKHRIPLTDWLAISALIVLHPMAWLFDQSVNAFTPDVAAYLSMARDALPDLQFYLKDWGMEGTHLILPPLFPLMILFGLQFSQELLIVAEVVASVSLLIVVIPLYFLVKAQSNVTLAFAASLAVSLNFFTAILGLTPLTEASYLLMSVCALAFFYRALQSKRGHYALLAGIFSGLAFLTRQIGLIHILFFLFYLTLITLAALSAKEVHWGMHANRGAKLVVGFLIIVLPWTVTIYLQTSQSPLTQRFSTAPSAIPDLDNETISRLQAIQEMPDTHYEQILAKRRQLLQLLPDGSDFISRALPELKSSDKPVTTGIQDKLSASANRFCNNLKNNISHLANTIGAIPVILFFFLCAAQYCVRSVRNHWRTASMLPLFCLCYLLVISWVTGQVERYVLVIQPLLICFIAVATYSLGQAVNHSFFRHQASLMGLIALLICVISYPLDIRAIDTQPKTRLDEIPLTRYRNIIQAGTPVMAISPLFSILAGGQYRVLPNDSLERTVAYARNTGVLWILLSRSANERELVTLYNHAYWYRWPDAKIAATGLVTLCCQLEGGQFLLAKINK